MRNLYVLGRGMSGGGKVLYVFLDVDVDKGLT